MIASHYYIFWYNLYMQIVLVSSKSPSHVHTYMYVHIATSNITRGM